MERKGRTDLIYAKVRELTEGGLKGNSRCNSIKDENGELLMKPKKVKDRWKDYIEDLYDKEGRPTEIKLEKEGTVEEDSKGSDVMDREITYATEHLKKKKAEDSDGIPAELLKNLGVRGTKEICKQIYISGE